MVNQRIAIFASGTGTNAENIIKYFQGHEYISVDLVLSNKPDAKVLDRARKYSVETFIFSRDDLRETDTVLNKLKEKEITFIVLAGFLLLIPMNIIRTYPNRMINIHPALLPKYGGKGMFGDNVHRAVKESGDRESGISIHYVNERYDEGNIIFQAKCEINPEKESIEEIADKVHELEYKHYPLIIERTIDTLK